jgi:hypothetical protein
MRIPVMRGVIDRRILVNYHVDPALVARYLPPPFRPHLVHGLGMVGICLIRVKHLRPAFLPAWLGMSSENAADRTVVEWDDQGTVRHGVYVRRRDTKSRLSSLASGRLFPGIQHHARFTVEENADHYRVAVRSDDGVTNISVRGTRTDKLPPTSVFQSLEEASASLEGCSLGYSATRDPRRFQGLQLHCFNWRIEPLEIEEARSNFLADESLFPKGSLELDCAVLLRGVHHEWHGQPDLCCPEAAVAPTSE